MSKFKPDKARKRNYRYRKLLLAEPARQPLWTNVEMLVNFDDDSLTNGVSEDQNGWSLTFGLAQTTTSVSKFGAKSLRLGGGATANVTFTAFTEMKITNQSVTIEGWVRFDSALGGTDKAPFLTRWAASTNNREYWFGFWNGKLEVWGSSDGTAVTTLHSEAWSPSADTWYHVAWCVDRSTEESRIFIDGVQQGNAYDTTGFSFYNSSLTQNQIGDYDGSNGENWIGYIDEWRLSKEALYTQNFIPPGQLPVGA